MRKEGRLEWKKLINNTERGEGRMEIKNSGRVQQIKK